MSGGKPLKALCWEGHVSRTLDTVTFIFDPSAYRGPLHDRDTAEHGGLVTCVTPPRILPIPWG